MGLFLRQVDVDRLEHALMTILSPLAYPHCDNWRNAVESSVLELLDGDHIVFGLPHRGMPIHIHSMNIAAQPERGIQTIFGGLPGLPTDPWLQEAELERQRSSVQVWSRLRAFWRAAAGQPRARRQSAFIGEVVHPGRIYDSENIDWSVAGGHVALCISYSNLETSARRRRSSPRAAAGSLLRILLPALKLGVTTRLAHDRESAPDLSLASYGFTSREAEVARLLARRATNREIAEILRISPHTVRHHVERVFAKLGVRSRRVIARYLEQSNSVI